jgi:hypothetical protein
VQLGPGLLGRLTDSGRSSEMTAWLPFVGNGRNMCLGRWPWTVVVCASGTIWGLRKTQFRPEPKKRTEPESKPESDFSGADLGVRSGRGPESPSPRGSPICFGPGSPSPRRGVRFALDPRVRVQGGARFALGTREPEPKPKEEPDLLWTRDSESKGGSDWLWTDLARHLVRLDLLGRPLFGPLRKRALF